MSLTDILVRPKGMFILFKGKHSALRKGHLRVETKYPEAIPVSVWEGGGTFAQAA